MPPELEFELTGTNCGAPGCGEPQFKTPSGVCCENGHGDAPALDDARPASGPKAHDITRRAEQGELVGDHLAAAMRQKKLGKKRRPLYDAAVSGTALRLRAQYIARRCSASKEPRRAVEKACEAQANALRRAAENVLELGCTVEHYVDVAFDTKPAKLAFPPLPHLSGPLMLEKVTGWLPPDQRADPNAHLAAAAQREALAAGIAGARSTKDDPNPALHEVVGEDLDVTWAKQEAYERGKAAGLPNDEIRKLIAAAAEEAQALLARGSNGDDEENDA